MNRIVVLALGLLVGSAARAQAPAAAAATDVILRADGEEIPGRVLTISPLEIRYLAPGATDTLRLATAEVFLIRYANGTREVLRQLPTAAAAPAAPDLLPGLSLPQRRQLATQAAARSYTTTGPFWISLGSTLYLGPLIGVAVPASMAPHPVALNRLQAPRPELLNDPVYGDAYRREAQRLKRNRAWGGYAVGTGAWLVVLASLVSGLQ